MYTMFALWDEHTIPSFPNVHQHWEQRHRRHGKGHRWSGGLTASVRFFKWKGYVYFSPPPPVPLFLIFFSYCCKKLPSTLNALLCSVSEGVTQAWMMKFFSSIAVAPERYHFPITQLTQQLNRHDTPCTRKQYFKNQTQNQAWSTSKLKLATVEQFRDVYSLALAPICHSCSPSQFWSL